LAEILIARERMIARQVLPRQFYLITRRCAQRQFLLRPDTATNNAFLYCLVPRVHGRALASAHRPAKYMSTAVAGHPLPSACTTTHRSNVGSVDVPAAQGAG